MVWRKLWRNLPIFLSYIVFDITRTCFLFAERNNDVAYFYGYWLTEALANLAVLCVIKELFDNAFERRMGLRRLGNVLFQWSIALLLVMAVIIAWNSPGADAKKLMAGIYVIKRTITFVEAGLLCFLFLFVFAFGIGWQHYAVGVFLGFGIYGAVELVAITARAMQGPRRTPMLAWAIMTVNNVCVFIWASYFLAPVPVRQKQPALDAEKRLEELNEALLLILKR